MKKILLILVPFMFRLPAYSQHKPEIIRCETMEHLEELKQSNPGIMEGMEQLEQQVQAWLRDHQEELVTAVDILKIPVVVHVLWNQADSSGNISDEQIKSQIDVLNLDFRRKNADKSKTPAAFLPFAADPQIEFKLASQDPDSNPTAGIIRKQTVVQYFNTKKNDIKLSIRGGDDAWPKNKYLNIWVGSINPGWLGYSQFPSGGPDSTDGVVISTKSFGATGTVVAPYDKGRTATHEVAHWLNLRHIWGDDNGLCSGTDQVNDTPNQSGPNSCCPTFPLADSCTSSNPGAMYMNYMDYSHDTILNLFTTGQKSRMRSTLKTGVRLPILSSPGILAALDTNPNIRWQRSLGGNSVERANTIKPTSDGGYITAGYTWSNNGDVSGNHGSIDFWVVKLTANGAIQWQKCLGGSNNDVAYAVCQTFDGGYMIAGNTLSNNGDVMGYHSSYDCWITKLSPTGTLEWQKCLGGALQDYAQCIIQTSDSGYALAGYSNSNDADVSGNHGGMDFWVVRLNASGDTVWTKSLGGPGNEYANSIVQSTNGTFIVAGYATSGGGQVTGYHGGAGDFWVVKLSSSGSVVWKNCYGGSLQDNAYSVKQTKDGGYILAGNSNSNNYDVSGTHGFQDFWVMKISSAGTLNWQIALGGSTYDYAYDIIQAKDGGYLVGGHTSSNNMNVSGNHGGYDYWVTKLTENGVFQWQKCFGGTGNDYAYSCGQGSDGSYVLAGYTLSNDHDVSGGQGQDDFWIVRFSDCQATIEATPTQTYCPGGTLPVTLTANEQGGSYLWNTGATSKSIAVFGPGLFSVTITNGPCLAASRPVEVTMMDCNGAIAMYDTGITYNTIYLEWYNSSCGLQGYQLQYRYTGGGGWSSSINIPYDADGVYNYALTGLFSNTGYDVKVRAKCATGNFSNWGVISTGTSALRPAAGSSSATFTVYPNPARETLHYNLEQDAGEVTVTIYSLLGEKLLEKKIYNREGTFSGEADIGFLTQGLYLIVAKSHDNFMVTRFVRE